MKIKHNNFVGIREQTNYSGSDLLDLIPNCCAKKIAGYILQLEFQLSLNDNSMLFNTISKSIIPGNQT